MGGSPLPPLAALPGQVSTKNRLRVTQILLFVSRLAPESSPFPPPLAPPTPPLGLPSNCGRVAEIFSLLQAKARQHPGPRRGAGWGLAEVVSCALGEPGCLGVLWAWAVRGQGLTAQEKLADGRQWWWEHRHRSGLCEAEGSGGARRPSSPAVHSVLSHLLSLGLSFLLDETGTITCIISLNVHMNLRRHLSVPFYWLGN